MWSGTHQCDGSVRICVSVGPSGSSVVSPTGLTVGTSVGGPASDLHRWIDDARTEVNSGWGPIFLSGSDS